MFYKSTFRKGTLIVRIFISLLAVMLIMTGALAAIGMLNSMSADTGSLVFIFLTLTIGIIIFLNSGWNIRRYLIYDDRLEIRILGGIKKKSYSKASLLAFNDLRMLTTDPSGGIGIVTQDNRIVKILELEIDDFPKFIEELQKIVRWDLTLKYESKIL